MAMQSGHTSDVKGDTGKCFVIGLVCAALAPAQTLAASKCELKQVAELPITMSGSRAQVPTKINGAEARFFIDSGAFWSIMSKAAAAQYQLKLYPPPYGLTVRGVGGKADVSVVRVKDFELSGF